MHARELFPGLLVQSLGAHGQTLDAIGREDAAREAWHEGIRSLNPLFRADPNSVVGLMAGLIQDYLDSCKATGVKPDGELLGPIVAKFDE